MEFAEVLRSRREELKLGVRELARATEKPWVPQPIKSAIYISRLENKVVEEMRAESISIDKLWALGVALRVSPLVLLSSSRSMPALLDSISTFSMRDCEHVPFSSFLKAHRNRLDLTLLAVEEKSLVVSPWSISTGYLSQLETNVDDLSERLSAEKLWALGRVLDVDPLLMYVLSRGIDSRYLSAISRDRLFS